MPSSRVEVFSLTHAQILNGSQTFLDAALTGATPEALDIYGVNEASLSPNTDSFSNEGDDVVMSRWNWLVDADLEVQAGYLSLPLIEEMTGRPMDVLNPIDPVNEVQTITVTATSGTFTITVGGETTTDLAYNATNPTVSAALLALGTVDDGDIAVTGSSGTYVLTYGADYGGKNVPLAVLGTGSLVGGTATIAETTPGAAASASGYGMDLWHEDDFNVAPRPGIIKMPSKDEDGVVRTLTIGLYKIQFMPITFDGPSYKDGLKINYNGTALFSSKDEMGQPFADGKKRVGRLLSHG